MERMNLTAGCQRTVTLVSSKSTLNVGATEKELQSGVANKHRSRVQYSGAKTDNTSAFEFSADGFIFLLSSALRYIESLRAVQLQVGLGIVSTRASYKDYHSSSYSDKSEREKILLENRKDEKPDGTQRIERNEKEEGGKK